MATLTDIHARLNNANLRNRVLAQCLLEVKTVMTEDVGVTNHAERLAWAGRFLSSPAAAQAAAQRMMAAIIALSPDATYETDASIAASVAAVLTTIAVMEAS